MEQKNSTLVRAYLGTARLDTVAQTAALNVLYDQMWGYYNLFQPVMHLKEKVASGTRLTRRWDTAKTPLARLLATAVLSEEQQRPWRAQWQGRIRDGCGRGSTVGCGSCCMESHRGRCWIGPHDGGRRRASGVGRWTCGQVRQGREKRQARWDLTDMPTAPATATAVLLTR